MHNIEPFFNWRHLYTAEEDEFSPFYGKTYSEFEFSNTIYNYYIHPQWDDIGSNTLFLKVLYVDYTFNYAVIELIGEWNDTIENDIMQLKRELIDRMIELKVCKFILVCENVLIFHSDVTDYYEEWQQDISLFGGWIVALNMSESTHAEFAQAGINQFVYMLDLPNWRNFQPLDLFNHIDNELNNRLLLE